jgi:Ca-activated chloride channel family protein
MRFEHPHILWLLFLVVPGMVGFFWWAARQKKLLMDQAIHRRLLDQLITGASPRRQTIRCWLWTLAAAFLVVALARPQWGFDLEEVRQQGLDIVVAIDTSRSMLAEDVSPNRLTRAKLAALDLRKLARADRMGLIAFAGTAFLQCPLSSDDEAFSQSVNELNVNIIPQGGTALAEAIENARAAFRQKTDNHRVLVLFTDGEDHDGSAVEAARAAAKDGLRIFTIGVGTPNGELLRTTDAKGRSEYIKDSEGHVVKSQLNDKLLAQIAEATQGFYLPLGGAQTIDILYERGLAPLPKGELAARQVKRFHERFQWFLLAAIVLLVGEMLLPERRREKMAAESKLAKAAAFGLLCLLPWSGRAASASKAWRDYGAGKFERALHQYEDLLEKKPNDPRLNFNAGDAAFQSGFYDKALKRFNSSLATEDLALQEQSFYNLGNTHYRLGAEDQDTSKKQANWEQAVSSYESALKLNSGDADAKHNLEWVKKRLEELKQQQEQQKNQNQEEKNQNKDQ